MATEELDDLRAEAEELGVKVDRRWGAERLREEIAAARRDDDEPDDDGDLEVNDLDEPDESDEHAPPVLRAGGHIDRGDGRGWVVEQDEE